MCIKGTVTIIILLLCSLLYAQTWNAPVNISNLPGADDDPEFCIDNAGTIHCVWSHQFLLQDRRILYSKSFDDGLTWSTPSLISEDMVSWMAKPMIRVDSHDNLHVIYNYDIALSSQIHYRKFNQNGQYWEDIVNISGSNYGLINHCMAIDNTDKVYVFFGIVNDEDYQTFYYLFNDSSWTGPHIPFPDCPDYFLITEVVVDSKNDLHCSGAFHYQYMSFEQDKAGYAHYDLSANQWSSIYVFDIGGRNYLGRDIALDIYEHPHLVWVVYYSGVRHSYFTGLEWTYPDSLPVNPYGKQQTIAIDSNNTIHLVQQECYGSQPNFICNLFYYNSNLWEGHQITFSQNIATKPHLVTYNNSLYLLYENYDSSQGGGTEVFLMKCQLPSSFIPPVQNLSEPLLFNMAQNYPNPFRNCTNFTFQVGKQSYVRIEIFNIKGQLISTLVNGLQNEGEHSITWDGHGIDNREMPSGVYYCRATCGNITTIKKFIKMQ